MFTSQIVTENQLDDWVRGNAAQAQGKIVELVWRLVVAACPRPIHRRFPLGDSIGQHGADGELETDIGFLPFIPEGKSIWEIGTNLDAHDKANSDYANATKATPAEIRKESTFIFVTPLSGRRGWKETWSETGINDWIDKKRHEKEWKDIVVLDGTKLTDWTIQFPAVGHWLASLLGHLPGDFETAESRWELISNYGNPPPLNYSLFTVGRDNASEKIKKLVVDRNDMQLRLDTRFPRHGADYVSAFIESMPEEERQEHISRVLIFQTEEAWKNACGLNESHVFVADFDLDTERGAQLIQRALQRRHAVVFTGLPGGQPHGNCVELFPPRVHQLKEALIKSGYREERARTLTNRSGNDLNALVRLLQGLSAMPEWVTQSEASDLAIAQLLGEWQEESEGDQKVAGELSGKKYGEWINNIRKISGASSAPFEFFNGRWKFTSRFEPWIYLGHLIGPDTLERFERLSIEVLSEADPELGLPKDKRFAASVYGKERRYSRLLRHGMAETLALLGAHGDTLKNCPDGRSEIVAQRVVNKLLEGADSARWASLNDVLPLLAEASPEAFLRAIGGASEKRDQPFSGVFAEEVGGVGGRTYSSGLLWALESLAWSNDYLIRVCGILANLAAVDPGGNYSNRPSNSLVTILLPWLPQTCAGEERRHAAVKSIVREQPKVAWTLIIHLLPRHHGTSSSAHKPKWRDYIPADWRDGVIYAQQWADEACYATLALELAGHDVERLSELVNYYFLLDLPFRQAYRERLTSEKILQLPENQRLQLWTALTNCTSTHRKYAESDVWTQPEEALQKLDTVAEMLRPIEPEVRHRRLFSGRDFDLYDENGNWDEQRIKLLNKRIKAIREIIERGGFDNLLQFSRSVESPQDVGGAFGSEPELSDDAQVLPVLLESSNQTDISFATSYIWNRFRTKLWDWVDELDRSKWGIDAKVKFFSVLPFVNDAWERVAKEFGKDEDEYWKRTRVHPDRDQLERIGYAIDKLVANGRSDAAIQCFWLGGLKGGLYSELGLRTLEKFGNGNHVDAHAIGELFNYLQTDLNVDENRLAVMEVKFLELLDRFGNARPTTLFRHLAERPDFFCEVIRLLYRSKNEVGEAPGEKIEPDKTKEQIARRAYRLLGDWDYPPGRIINGDFDPERLISWMEAVKAKCIESGHWKVASHHIGEILFYAPREEDGLWVEAVCELLDSKEDVEFRRGLYIKIVNSRDAYFFSGGQQEIELADKWGKVATLAENKGFARLGGILRDLEKSYRKEATRSVTQHRQDFD